MEQDSNFIAITPLEGRYRSKILELEGIVSEEALTKYRVRVELLWLKHLLNISQILSRLEVSNSDRNSYIQKISSILQDSKFYQYNKIKQIESKTNHDIKAIEIYIREYLKEFFPEKILALIHFGCTSEDINNISYALLIKDATRVLISNLNTIISILIDLSKSFSSTAMLSRTHGQPATPTTVGKEIAVFRYRLSNELSILEDSLKNIQAKLNGATGSFNALYFSFPDIDWMNETKTFLSNLGLKQSEITTQIESKGSICVVLDSIKRLSSILLDLSKDMWGYISLGYFKLKLNKNEVGSSTMPHKINPIDFENAEGNLGISIALLSHFTQKFFISRFQRDLSDSTVMRSLSVVFSYTLISYKSLITGLNKIDINSKILEKDLDNNYPVITEAIQTLCRSYGMIDCYDRLKDLTRGKNISKEDIISFIKELKLPKHEIDRLLNLSPNQYIGIADKLAKL